MAQSKPIGGQAATGNCPICSRPSDASYRPFCSRRCADVDLARWLSGAYAIPTRPDDDEDGDGPGTPDGGDLEKG